LDCAGQPKEPGLQELNYRSKTYRAGSQEKVNSHGSNPGCFFYEGFNLGVANPRPVKSCSDVIMIILGLETSCDETAAAIVADGRKILASEVATQIDVHRPYGGVVPELASRHHIENIVPVLEAALQTARVSAAELDGVAVTQGPGLVGALLVGFSFAKAFAYARGLPWVGVDHLEGHLNSVFLVTDPPPFPFIALLASGGHTAVYRVSSHTEMFLLGQTRDDAAGEAYDKVSKMLGLGYPGGKVIDDLAARGDPAKIHFTRPYLDKDGYDFSFSGIKTAVNRYIQTHADEYPNQLADIAAGFQEAVVEVLSYKVLHAARENDCRHVALVGGVAANSGLRARVTQCAERDGITVYIPSHHLCGDNAAMIAATGYHYLKQGRLGRLEDDVYSRLRVMN
jgi:N6-L-threonylcarbamoyladenine synthase